MNNYKPTPSPTLGMYPGSFDPFHVGHLDIVNQARQIFDTMIVARGINSEKSQVDKLDIPEKFLNNLGIGVTNYNGLLTDLVKQFEGTYNVVVIRGLRNGADLEYEQNLVAFFKDMHPKIKVVAFYCDPKFRHVSSSALRGIKKFSEEEYKKYVISC